MATNRKLIPIFYFSFFLCVVISMACNNDTEKIKKIGDPTLIDTPKVADVDTMENHTGNVSSVVDTAAAIEPPKASLAYAYKNKMKIGIPEYLQVVVQLDKPLQDVENNLRKEVDRQAKAIGSTDTSIVSSVEVVGYKYLHVYIDHYDKTVFKIDTISGEGLQELNYKQPNKWAWRVTAKKKVPKSEIVIKVKSAKNLEDIKLETDLDYKILPIQITVAEKPGASFLARYRWQLISGLILILLTWLVFAWFKKKRTRELNSRIYFSYAWQNATDTIVDKLYNSLKLAGFNVIRDKVNLEYKGLISGFMKDIGKGNIIIVSISNKYLKSRFCMFELYEIYRNCGMSKEAFVKKIFPIREEDINLSDATVIDHYIDYWKAEELKLEAIVKDKSRETTSEQFAQYEAVKRIESELGNLLYFLSDINSLNIELLSGNDFAEIKKSLHNTVKELNKSD